jgi:hypothetical protein
VSILPLLGPDDAVNMQAADVDGDEFSNVDGDSKLIAYNQSGVPLRLVFTEARPCSYDQLQHASSTFTLAAGDQVPYGKFNPHRYSNTFRRVAVTYPDGVAGLWVASQTRP